MNLFISLAVAIAVVTGIGVYHYGERSESRADSFQEKAGQTPASYRRPAFSMVDIDGRLRKAEEWDGKVLLINFWATWCPPCLKEIPLFVELQEKYRERNFQIIGIAIDDENAVRDFALRYDINYPVIAADEPAVELTRRYGNRDVLLPYTVFVDADSNIVAAKAGLMSGKEVESIILPLLP